MSKRLLFISTAITFMLIIMASTFTIRLPSNIVANFGCLETEDVLQLEALTNTININCEPNLLPTVTDTPIVRATPTNTETLIPTNTVVAPTETSTITPTINLPTVTNTPTKNVPPTIEVKPTKIALKDYPECLTHNINEIHTLINKKDECHYDHTHGQDIHEVDNLFITAYPFPGLSYPHKTSVYENSYDHDMANMNLNKHPGNICFYEKTFPETGIGLNWNAPIINVPIAVRACVHFWSQTPDTTTRIHSQYIQIQFRNKITGLVGEMSIGSDWNTGILELYKLLWIPLPTDLQPLKVLSDTQWLPGFNIQSGKPIDNYRGYRKDYFQVLNLLQNPNALTPNFSLTYGYTSLDNDVLWTSSPNPNNENKYKYAGVAITKFDHADTIKVTKTDLTNPYSSTFELYNICQLAKYPNCVFNGSLMSLFLVWGYVDPVFDQSSVDTNRTVGIVTMSIYVDRNQNVNKNCTEIGTNCIPFILNNASIGWIGWQDRGNGKSLVKEFDLTPNDRIVNGRWESWIKQ